MMDHTFEQFPPRWKDTLESRAGMTDKEHFYDNWDEETVPLLPDDTIMAALRFLNHPKHSSYGRALMAELRKRESLIPWLVRQKLLGEDFFK